MGSLPEGRRPAGAPGAPLARVEPGPEGAPLNDGEGGGE